MNYFGGCEETTKIPIISLSEKNSSLKINNPERREVRKIRVDGCVITEGPRCDYLIISPKNMEYFIELKGSDVKHAIEQLEASIKKISQQPKTHPKKCYIISTSCSLLTTQSQKYKIAFKNHYGAFLFIKERNLQITIDE